MLILSLLHGQELATFDSQIQEIDQQLVSLQQSEAELGDKTDSLQRQRDELHLESLVLGHSRLNQQLKFMISCDNFEHADMLQLEINAVLSELTELCERMGVPLPTLAVEEESDAGNEEQSKAEAEEEPNKEDTPTTLPVDEPTDAMGLDLNNVIDVAAVEEPVENDVSEVLPAEENLPAVELTESAPKEVGTLLM
jgi:DNA repair exonuclease SbcCD ATPase subunit